MKYIVKYSLTLKYTNAHYEQLAGLAEEYLKYWSTCICMEKSNLLH